MTLAEKMRIFSGAGLYAVTAEELSNGRTNLEVVQALLDGGVTLIQLREKNISKQNLLQMADKLRKLTSDYQALLIINDDIELALACGADGVHLGQEDMQCAAAGKIAPDLIIGVSTHNEAQAVKAQHDGATYVNLGPVYLTQTKKLNRAPVGIELILQMKNILTIPFTVMGGINESNFDEPLSAGAPTLAMVSALTKASDITESARRIRSHILTRRKTYA